MPEKKRNPQQSKSSFFSSVGKNFTDVLKVANRAFINQIPYGREVKTAESVGKRIVTRTPVVSHVVATTSTVANHIPIVNKVKSGIASSDPLAKYSTRPSSNSPPRKSRSLSNKPNRRPSSPTRKSNRRPSSPTRKSDRRQTRK